MDEVLYEKRNESVWLTINRETRRNTLTLPVVNTLRAHIARANHDNDIQAIVITGSGDMVFCAGGDLSREAADQGVMPRFEANKSLAELFTDMSQSAKPILARVNGHALGAGFAIMLACDLAVVVDDIRMGAPELKVGIFPMLTLGLLVRHLGSKRAMELVITTQQLTGSEAEYLGLANAAVPRDELDEKVDDLLSRITGHSPVAIRLGRQALVAAQDLPFAAGMDYLLAQLSLNMQTEDASEGAQAFLQKRAPKWKGR
jgi:enoyl-CoA hydratase/carnithine racemase